MVPNRTLPLDTPCPRCGGKVWLREEGVMAAGSAEPIGWVPVELTCLAGCVLTATDFVESSPGEGPIEA